MAYLKSTTINGNLTVTGSIYTGTATDNKRPVVLLTGTSDTNTGNTTSVSTLKIYSSGGTLKIWTA